MTAVSTRTLRVVIADDSPDMRLLLQVVLGGCDALSVVGVADNGPDAVRLAEEERPDLVVLDIAMPGMDGLEAAARIRQLVPRSRIVVLSAFRSDRMEAEALRAGADVYLEKAAEEGELLAALERLFPGTTLVGSVGTDVTTEVDDVTASVERRYHLLLDALEEGVVVVDAATATIVDSNFAASQIFGVPTTQILGNQLSSLGVVLPETRRPFSGVSVAYRRPDGDRRRLLVSSRPLGGMHAGAAGETVLSLVDVTEHHRSEARYRELAAALPDTVVMVCDPELRFQIVTGGGAEGAGWHPDELIGRTVDEVLPEAVAPRLLDAYRSALAGHATTLDDLVASRTGRLWRTTFVPVRDEDGGVVAAMAVARDVTERAEAVAAVKAGEERLHAAVSTMLDPFVVLRSVRDDADAIVDFVYEYANRAAGDANGIDPAELIGKRLLDLLPAHRDTGLFDRYVETVETGRPLVLDGLEYEDSWGGVRERRVFDVRAVRVGDGLAFTWRDVTRRESMARELADAHTAAARAFARLDAVVDAAPLAIAAIDTSDRVTLWSKGAEQLFGWREEEILGRALPIVPDDQRDEYASSRSRERGGEPLVGVELIRRHKDGHAIPVAFYTAPVVDDRGDLVETVGVIVDITERKESERLLVDALDRARRSSEARTSLMWALAHDVRNPLTVIRGFAQTLAQRGDRLGPDQQRVLLGRIAAQADALFHLTADLLESERLEESDIAPAPVDLSRLVAETIADVDCGDHPLSVDVPPTVVRVDPTRMRRIVVNLVTNAVRHTPPGTPVSVRLERAGEAVVLAVEDAGPGVPVAERDHIFEPFRKGSSSTGGTGLGLSLVARFAADQGGRVWVEDRPGGGASFKVLLPSS